MNSIIRFASLSVVDAVVLAFGAPSPARLIAAGADPQGWIARVGVDAASAELAGAALWLTAAWLALGLLATGATVLPGRFGSYAHHLARQVLPAAVRRAIAGAAGVGIALAPAAAGAAAPPAAAPPVLGAVVEAANSGLSTAGTPAPVWPSDASVPAPVWPRTPDAHPRHRPHVPAATAVRVLAGDSLWSIAAAHLPATHLPATHPGARAARTARAWPHWYDRNRSIIGADPAYLRPGEILQTPTGARTHSSTEGGRP